ncbi:uncharacterized protein EV420DRAFT_1652403 [Desarmillaria tabescens]|uniref:Uncharacterized protein n=1 Tax=Armillaria tabescens TaxID=1929756 RepID=A0AA39MJ46_ARMTA|nr:uncharacterized protein EV420DRAFT_1652403 [Desarmillaria tabescens]KAK0436801.1 hypothetical protein EV420DRAFT_1652403 [Desarmillaria tabescens]
MFLHRSRSPKLIPVVGVVVVVGVVAVVGFGLCGVIEVPELRIQQRLTPMRVWGLWDGSQRGITIRIISSQWQDDPYLRGVHRSSKTFVSFPSTL